MESSIDLTSTKDDEKTDGGHFLPGSKLLKQFRTWRDSKTKERSDQKEFWRYYDGDHWTEEELHILRLRGQPPTYYNEIRRKVNGIIGVEEQIRRDPKAFGRNPNPQDENAASVATKSIRYVCENNSMDKKGSEVLKNGSVGGFSGIRLDLHAEREEITFSVVDDATTFYDPRSKRADFSDAKFLGTWDWVDKDDAKQLLPNSAEKIDEIFSCYKSNDFSELPDDVDRGEESWVNSQEDTVFLIEHWYKNNGLWHCAYHLAGVVLEEWVSPLKDDNGESAHLFELWSPNIKKDGQRYGAVKDMIPIQDAINKRASKLLHMLNTRQTRVQRGAIEDIDEMKLQLQKPDGVIEYDVEGGFDIISNNDQISGQAQLMQHDLSQMDRSGPNNALIGRGTESQSGVAIKEQKNSGVTELSPDLQEFRDWKLRVYRKIWNMIRAFWTKERFIRVTDNLGAADFVGLNKPVVDDQGMIVIDPATGAQRFDNQIAQLDVDIILDEGPDTMTVQQEDFNILSSIMPFLRESGQNIPAKIIFQASPIRNKEEIIQALEDQERMASEQGPDPIAMEQIKLEQATLKAKIDEIVSQIELNTARSIKEQQQAAKLAVENEAEAHELAFKQTMDQAALNNIQAQQTAFVDPMGLPEYTVDPDAYGGIDYQ